MDSVSVSKGVFAQRGSYKIGAKRKQIQSHADFDEPWYKSYKEAWSVVQNAANEISASMFKQILIELKSYVESIKRSSLENYSKEISTAILLTGVNLPDHDVLFKNLSQEFATITKCIAIVQSRDSGNLKNLVEETVFQLINGQNYDEKPDIRKNQCSLRILESWHSENCERDDPLIIIVPDFESFTPSVFRDFIIILSAYTKSMKFVLVFGVATSLHAVHKSFSYDVTSKLRVQVFHTQTQVESLSDVFESTVLSGKTPFKLTGRAFQLLTDIFLFYDFSVRGFLQGYKLCMLQHFYDNNLASLCCELKDTREKIAALDENDIKELKNLPSIVKYMEKLDKSEDSDFKELVANILSQFHTSMKNFLVMVKCLHSVCWNLPGRMLGTQLREVYCTAVMSDIVETREYKNSMVYFKFLSKEEFCSKIKDILKIVEDSNNRDLDDVAVNLSRHLIALKNASLEIPETSTENVSFEPNLSRAQLKEKLLTRAKERSESMYDEAQKSLLEYLNRDVFGVYLTNPSRLTGNEIFCFSDVNAAKHPIRGSLRAAIQTALVNPHVYVECVCCKLENEQTIQGSLPDISIIFKLHLESRKLINMYDWLQAFLTIVDPSEDDDEQRDIDPEMQGRFTQAVAELEVLGFIKTSRRKTDHVKRLT